MARRRALVLIPYPEQRQRAREILEDAGVDVFVAGGFREAVGLARDKSRGFDVVIMRDMLGEVAWQEVVERIRRGRLAPPTIVLLWVREGEDRRARERGVRHAVEVSGGMEGLKKALISALREREDLMKKARDVRCGCGAAHTSFPEMHSTWCPRFENERD